MNLQERIAQFRKMATWYCKALRTGKAIQQILVLLDSPQTFARLVNQLREQGPPLGWSEWDATDAHVAVPAGPIAPTGTQLGFD